MSQTQVQEKRPPRKKIKEWEYQRPQLYPKQQAAIFDKKRISVIEASTKSGKAQPLTSMVWTLSGPCPMGNIRVGNNVCTPDGISQVIGIFPQGKRRIYKITFNDGTEVRCDAEHLWEIHADRRDYRRGFYNRLKANPGMKRRKDNLGWPRVLSTVDLVAYSQKTLQRLWVPGIYPIQFPHQKTPLNPYLVGVLIGDGNLDKMVVSSMDQEILDAVRSMIPFGHSLNKIPGDNVDWAITAGENAQRLSSDGVHIRGYLRELGLNDKRSHEKFIPWVYTHNSVDVRWSILQGILDTDGWVDKMGQPHLEQTSEQLARDVSTLVETLGGSVLTRLKLKSGYRKFDGTFVPCRPVYRQGIRFDDPSRCFRLARKKILTQSRKRSCLRRFSSIVFDGEEETQCIQLDDPRGLYLTDGCIPTHNTASAILWLFEQAAFHGKPGRNYWWVAPVFRQSLIAFNRMMRAIPEGLATPNLSNHYITLINGSIIWFLSADNPDTLYGEDVHAAVIDEASRLKEQAWHAVRTTVTATQGPIRIIGNVKGRRNWFYMLARKAETANDPALSYHKLTSVDAVAAGILPQEEIEEARRTIPDLAFRELYMAEASEDQGNPFGFEAIQKCIKPLQSGPALSFGWDLAKHVDWTVGIGLNGNGETCKFDRFQMDWEQTHNRIINFTGNSKALVDSTGVGDPVLERLQRVPNTKFEGYTFNSQSKQKLMEGLAVSIQSGKITFPDGPIVEELNLFEYTYTHGSGVRYSAPEGYHDDCVMALALANIHKTHVKPSLHISADVLARARMPDPRRAVHQIRWGSF